ncbi:MAG: hypothetical protein ACLRX5_09080 [Slackia sp.]
MTVMVATPDAVRRGFICSAAIGALGLFVTYERHSSSLVFTR